MWILLDRVEHYLAEIAIPLKQLHFLNWDFVRNNTTVLSNAHSRQATLRCQQEFVELFRGQG